MLPLSLEHFRQWVRHAPHPLARRILWLHGHMRGLDLPYPKFLYSLTYTVLQIVSETLQTLLRLFLWTPLFKSKLAKVGKHLYLYEGLPCMTGPLHIEVGNSCRINGNTTISGRSAAREMPTFILGNNIDLGWMTTVAVGRRVQLGDNVRIAGQCFLAGYPGHPIDAKRRAAGFPESDHQVGDIILENDVWLATGVFVMAGVTIGEGTIVGAGSVVTKDLPAHVLAGGNPARVIRPLNNKDRGEQ